ncbi:MAG: DUF1643 domain-containing protein [Proteobacteria bacterium]|nr:DUF1643 domain-containing protein [Pseudomonadota bacterium]
MTQTFHHNTLLTQSAAVYSADKRYRYSLTRCWNATGPGVMFLMLNPSTATESQNDPTVERCERRARALGFGSFCVTNIFAWRDTDPALMRAATDPIGPLNDQYIVQNALSHDQIVCAWGAHGNHLGRSIQVRALISSVNRPLYHLGKTKSGEPRHPLYISYSQQPVLWSTF